MRPSNQHGFTIIEVVLFLALSALFVLVAFMGVRGRTSAVQFTDSMRSLQSHIVSEQNKVLNGVNSSSTAPTDCAAASPTGESNSCILIGRVLSFGQESDLSISSTEVLYGTKPSAQNLSSLNDLEFLDASDPRSDGNSEEYTLSWGTEYRLIKSENIGESGNYDRIGWLRSPGSTRLIPIAFNETAPDDLTGVNNIYRTSATETRIGDQVNVRLCFEGAEGQLASIRFGDGQGNSSTDLVFDDEECRP